jgi:acyl transferase domain-containing protein
MLAHDGRCKTLDAAADGYVRSEAVGVLSLRCLMTSSAARLDDAGHMVPHVVLLGALVNQDGRSSSLTAPNGPAQTALIKGALQVARLQSGKVACPPYAIQ